MEHRDALHALRRLASRIGSDPLLVQGAGGNVSLKLGDTMWIKASGTWLADAETSDILVPVALPPSSGGEFAVRGANARTLRPSIETSLHAGLPHVVVLHVHSVDTIAWAVRADAAALLSNRLDGLPWAFVPYRQPGPKLTAAMRDTVASGIGVFVLANHGLVVAADDVDAADALLREVTHRLAISPRAPTSAPATTTGGYGFHPVTDPVIQTLATDPVSLAIAARGVLYPDHAVFLGPEPLIIDRSAGLDAALARVAAGGLPRPRWVIVRDDGVLIADDIARGGKEMLRCLADLAARIPADAELNVLGEDDIAALMNWEAEHYRQRLARTGQNDLKRLPSTACA